MASMQEKTPLQPPARSHGRSADRGRPRLRSFAAGVGLVVTFVAGAWLSIALMGPGDQPSPAGPDRPAGTAADAPPSEAPAGIVADAGKDATPPPATETEAAQDGVTQEGTAQEDAAQEDAAQEDVVAAPPDIAPPPSAPEPPPPPAPASLPSAPPVLAPALAPALVPLDTAFARRDGEPVEAQPEAVADSPDGTAVEDPVGTDPAAPLPEATAETAAGTEEDGDAGPPPAEPEQAGEAPAPALAMLPPAPAKPQPAAPDPASPGPASPGPAAHGPYTIQVGTFSVPENADRLVERLERQGFDAYAVDWTDGDGRQWRAVRTGNLRSMSEARRVAARVSARSGEPTSVIRLR